MFRIDTKVTNIEKENKEILCFSREIPTDETCFCATAGTTGNMYHDDTKRNALSYFSIENLRSNNILSIDTGISATNKKFSICVKGESEIRGIIKALKFIIKVLEEELDHVDD